MKIRIGDIVSDPDELVARLNRSEEEGKTGRIWCVERASYYSNMANPYMPTYHNQSAFS